MTGIKAKATIALKVSAPAIRWASARAPRSVSIGVRRATWYQAALAQMNGMRNKLGVISPNHPNPIAGCRQ